MKPHQIQGARTSAGSPQGAMGRHGCPSDRPMEAPKNMCLWHGLRYYWWFLICFLDISVFWEFKCWVSRVWNRKVRCSILSVAHRIPVRKSSGYFVASLQVCKRQPPDLFLKRIARLKEKMIERNGTSFIPSQHCLWVILRTISLPSTLQQVAADPLKSSPLMAFLGGLYIDVTGGKTASAGVHASSK